jgi:hypothetical protein
MVTTVVDAIVLVVTSKVAVVAPAGTVTYGCNWAAPSFELVIRTAAPPAGAGLSKVTVPVEAASPPTTAAGFMLTPTSAATGEVTVTVKVAVRLTLL